MASADRKRNDTRVLLMLCSIRAHSCSSAQLCSKYKSTLASELEHRVALTEIPPQGFQPIKHQSQHNTCLLATTGHYPRWEDKPRQRCRLLFNHRLVVPFHPRAGKVVQTEGWAKRRSKLRQVLLRWAAGWQQAAGRQWCRRRRRL